MDTLQYKLKENLYDFTINDTWPPLHSASQKGCLQTVISLLQKGADIDEKADGYTPLYMAAKWERKDIVKHLMEAGANINCSAYLNATELHFASLYGWLDIAQSLLKKGADIEIKSNDDWTPLLLAANALNKDIVELLINAGADTNTSSQNWSLLHYASLYGWLEMVQFLLKRGADIHAKTDGGWTPLLQAADKEHKDVVELLMNAGADINGSSFYNWSLLHYASKYGWLEIVQSLLKKGVDIHTKTDSGWTPLLKAAIKKHKDIVELLINAGADINCYSPSNWTLLHYASKYGWLEIVQSLLKKGADIEAKSDSGTTSLQFACNFDKIEIVQHLINSGAKVNVKSNSGNSALSSVMSTPNIELVGLLIESGAYISALDYGSILSNSFLKKFILQDIKLCSQAIINKFNHKDLPELYRLYKACKILPCIESIRIMNIVSNPRGNASQVTHEVMQSVKHEIELKGHCDLFKTRPIVLKMLAVKSFLIYCDNIKKQNVSSNQMKRSADSNDQQYANYVFKPRHKHSRFDNG